MSDGTFPVGSQWRTRGGWRAVVVGVGTTDDEIRVWHEEGDRTHYCHANGMAYSSLSQDPEDLIEPWREPKRIHVKGWITVFEDGFRVFGERRAVERQLSKAVACIEIDREVVEGEGLTVGA